MFISPHPTLVSAFPLPCFESWRNIKERHPLPEKINTFPCQVENTNHISA